MRRVDEAGRAAPPADGEKTLKDLF
jgi:hypothetical protein